MVSARNGIYYCSNMGQLAERLRRKFVALVYVGLNPSLPPKYKIYSVMVRKIKGNVVKCYRCGSMLKYDDTDIEEKECSYGVQSYAGETYMGKFITCPQCGDRIEVR